MASKLLVADLREGDIVFFAPTARGNFKVFAQLAAFVQSWPYPDDKPWYHVAVACGNGQIVDFAPGTPGDEPALWSGRLEVRALSDDDDTTLSALRLRNPKKAAALAEAAIEMRCADYAIPGLLTFAAATQARLFQD